MRDMTSDHPEGNRKHRQGGWVWLLLVCLIGLAFVGRNTCAQLWSNPQAPHSDLDISCELMRGTDVAARLGLPDHRYRAEDVFAVGYVRSHCSRMVYPVIELSVPATNRLDTVECNVGLLAPRVENIAVIVEYLGQYPEGLSIDNLAVQTRVVRARMR